MNAEAWQIDMFTWLLRSETGTYNVWWAGCLQSDEWVPALADIVEGSLLADCQAALLRPCDRTVTQHTVDVATYGESMAIYLILGIE